VRQRRLGRTDLQVSEIGFGAWAIGGNKHGHSYGPTDNAESLRTMARGWTWAAPFLTRLTSMATGLAKSCWGRLSKNIGRRV
jgi:hypothetical protein